MKREGTKPDVNVKNVPKFLFALKQWAGESRVVGGDAERKKLSKH